MLEKSAAIYRGGVNKDFWNTGRGQKIYPRIVSEQQRFRDRFSAKIDARLIQRGMIRQGKRRHDQIGIGKGDFIHKHFQLVDRLGWKTFTPFLNAGSYAPGGADICSCDIFHVRPASALA